MIKQQIDCNILFNYIICLGLIRQYLILLSILICNIDISSIHYGHTQNQLIKISIFNKQKKYDLEDQKIKKYLASTDLILQALNWPPRSEVIITGINIPDMVQVLRLNGLIPVPIEVDSHTLGCTLDQFQKFYSQRTKGIMISYVFGAKFDASDIIDWATSKDLFIMEDEAESFNAPNAKFLVLLKLVLLFEDLLQFKKLYPKWSQRNYFKRTLKNLIPMILLNSRTINRSSRWIFSNFFPNWDYKEFVVNSIRGFQKNPADILQTYRFRVPDPMLIMLVLRKKTFDIDQFNMSISRQLVGQSILKKGGLLVPGHAVEERKFWLYPVVVEDPETTYKVLNSRGIDAYMGVTQLDIVESPIGSSYQYPNSTLAYFKNILYLPIHQNADLKSIQNICKEVVEVVEMLKSQHPKL
ncbi:unnamed protein product [Paramecium pentaurelia]|uniref:DegT/DnrJ/EryC1/StrS aminotransferase family protein n=1 Tax=Paramecium pentaurelia TaxID=43138 RepID=A0A8S1UL98_9CILI|nr:unnamed protein product [Paramecium pentaurelia]